MRTIDELIDRTDPAWPEVLAWIDRAEVPVEVLPTTSAAAHEALLATQVTTRSPMGAIVWHSSGLIVDGGWLRILGSGGHAKLKRSLPAWNNDRATGFYLVADDAFGGSFAINGGAFGPDLRKIFYFAPDTLEWEPLDLSYTGFVQWALTLHVREFQRAIRSAEAEALVAVATGDQSINAYPPLFVRVESPERRSLSLVPSNEQYDLQMEFVKQLARPSWTS